MKFVITGGPGCGKSSVIEIIKNLGFNTVPESARIVIEEQQKLPNPILWNTDFMEFQKLIIKRQFELEAKISKFPVFLDRGLPDALAYAENYGVVLPENIINKIKMHKYSKVFILSPLPRNNYVTDNVRWEDSEKADKIHKKIKETYIEMGYNLVEIPVIDVKDRAKMIINESTR